MAKQKWGKYLLQGYFAGQKKAQEEEEFRKKMSEDKRQFSLYQQYRQSALDHQKAKDFTTVTEGDEFNKDYGIEPGVYNTSLVDNMMRQQQTKSQKYWKPTTVDGKRMMGEFDPESGLMTNWREFNKDTTGRKAQEDKEKAVQKYIGDMSRYSTEIIGSDLSEADKAEKMGKLTGANDSMLAEAGLQTEYKQVWTKKKEGKSVSQAIEEVSDERDAPLTKQEKEWLKSSLFHTREKFETHLKDDIDLAKEGLEAGEKFEDIIKEMNEGRVADGLQRLSPIQVKWIKDRVR